MSTRSGANDPSAWGTLEPLFLPAPSRNGAAPTTGPAVPSPLGSAEGEAKPAVPAAGGGDPRGLPPQALAVAIGSVPGGTGAPGYYFLPLPGAASLQTPGDLSAGVLPSAPSVVLWPETAPPPTPTPTAEAPAPVSPATGAADPYADSAVYFGGPRGAPPASAHRAPSAEAPGGPTAPVATPSSRGTTSVAPPSEVWGAPAAPIAAPFLPSPDADLDVSGEDHDGAGVDPRGAAPSVAPPARSDAGALDGHDLPPGVPPPASAEDAAALRLALDLQRRIDGPSAALQGEPIRHGERLGAVPHLPTSDAGIRRLVSSAFGLTPPEAATDAPDAPAVPGHGTAQDLYFLPAVPRVAAPSADGFDVNAVRRDFPVLQQRVHGKPLVWFDNAATTQKPQAVIDAVSRYYEQDNSNIHRGAHALAARSTEAYENARSTVRRYLGASLPEEIVFVRGTTEAINLVAKSWGRKNVGQGDEIVLTQLEHHANIVPWQMLAQRTGAVLKVVPVTDRGEVILEAYTRLLGPRTRLVGVTQVSNALGTVVPVKEMAVLAHRHGVPILVDGAQSIPHLRVNVQDLDADFFVFSGHKIFAPMGIGVLYAKKEHLETMPPWQGGGSMIRDVTFERTTYSDPPAKFEAGTPSVADAVGLGAALEYLERLGIENLVRYEDELLHYATECVGSIPGIRLIGTAAHKVSVLSLLVEGARVEDVGRYLDGEGIAVRAGHHCAQPTMQRFGISGTVRPSLAFYNTKAEVDRLATALRRFRPGPS